MPNDISHTPTPIDIIAEGWVDTLLDLSPEYHVWLGRPGREGEYADYSPDGVANSAEAAKQTLGTLRTAEPVDSVDRVTKLDLVRELELQVEKHEAGFEQRELHVIASPPQSLRDIFDLVPSETEED